MIRHYRFLRNIGIIPLVNIDSDNMDNDIVPKSKNIPSIRMFEPTHLFDTKGKWLLVTTNNLKQDNRQLIDQQSTYTIDW